METWTTVILFFQAVITTLLAYQAWTLYTIGKSLRVVEMQTSKLLVGLGEIKSCR